MTLERSVGAAREFSVARGPFLRVLRRLHLTRGDGSPRAWAFVAIAWGPLFLGALLQVTLEHRPAPILFDISVHARLLIAIPLLIQAGRLLERRCRDAVAQLYDGELAEWAAVDRIIDRAERLRRSRLADVVILVVAILLGQAVLWGLVGVTGLIAGVDEGGAYSFARIWYAVVALPIAQFFYFTWLWQWGIWIYVVVRVSRLPLATIATHPDRAAGIGFLSAPLSAFGGFVFAVAAMTSAAWGTQLIQHTATLEAFAPSFAIFIVVVALVGCGPLCLYTGILYRARHRELRRYNGLALDYVRRFQRKWVDSRPASEPLLGTSDIQSLNDMMGAYEHTASVRLVPFGPRELAVLFLAAVLPMLPLVATTMPLHELLETLGGALFAGLPV